MGAQAVNQAYNLLQAVDGAMQVLYPRYFDLAFSMPELPSPDSGLSRLGRVKHAPAKLVAALAANREQDGWASAAQIGDRIRASEANPANIVDSKHFIDVMLYQFRRGGPLSESMALELKNNNLQIEFMKIPANVVGNPEELVMYRTVPRLGSEQPGTAKMTGRARKIKQSAGPAFEAKIFEPRATNVGATAIRASRKKP